MNLAQTIRIYGGGKNSGPSAPCPQCGPGQGRKLYPLTQLKRTAAKNIRKLSVEQALDIIHQHAKRGPGIGDPEIKKLTGGYSSQTIDFIVMQKLGEHAGLRRKG